jgi:hypothetical protein
MAEFSNPATEAAMRIVVRKENNYVRAKGELEGVGARETREK